MTPGADWAVGGPINAPAHVISLHNPRLEVQDPLPASYPCAQRLARERQPMWE